MARSRFGNSPFRPTPATQMRVLSIAILFSTLQATMQARQSMQRVASKRKALCLISVMCLLRLSLLYRYKGLAERLPAADRVGVGDVQVRVAGADAVGGGQALGEMPVTRASGRRNPGGWPGWPAAGCGSCPPRWSLPPSRCPSSPGSWQCSAFIHRRGSSEYLCSSWLFWVPNWVDCATLPVSR